jgi:CRISPR-associated endonuclease/helicase Cas3
MSRAFAKANRIGQVERLLLTSRVPLSQAEIARRCEVHRSTIGRLIQDMIDDGIPVRQTEDDQLYIERTAYLSRIHLKLHEATAVFLACRLLARYSDKPNSHTVVALEKLSAALQATLPNLGQHIGSTSALLQQQLPKQTSEYQRVLEHLTEAWARGVKVRLWYRALRARRPFQHTFAPYFLEPSAIGYSTYAIGLSEPPNALRTRKLERIERVELTDEPFVVPADFDPNALLAGAWGIWFDEEDQPTKVVLRFSGEQAIRRVRETTWHPSQRTELDAEGRLLWSAEIDEPKEMLPWIRGWGSACEVLTPATLRDQVIGDVRRQMGMYDLLARPQDPAQPDSGLLGALFGGGS